MRRSSTLFRPYGAPVPTAPRPLDARMAWIRTPKLPPDHPELLRGLSGLPAEYGKPASETVPASVRAESIVLSHALLPGLLGGMFSGYCALLAPDSPLSRREQELIAVGVSKLNDCFY